MREIIFKGQRKDNKEWVEGYLFRLSEKLNPFIMLINKSGESYEVLPETVGQYTGLKDKNGKRIFEHDVVQYNTYDDFDCHSIVKFGEYEQDGSGGEYSSRKCIGFYVDVDNFTCPDWCDNEPECFPYHMWQQNILEVASECEIIGNIHSNPELLE